MEKQIKGIQAEKSPMDSGGPIFKDPKEYEHLPMEVRQKMTDTLMQKMKGWAEKQPWTK
jgi:hypothetical protein